MKTDNMTFEESINFLNEQGYTILYDRNCKIYSRYKMITIAAKSIEIDMKRGEKR